MILKDLVSNQLSLDEYPSVIPMPPMSNSSSTGVASSARRRGKSVEKSSRRKGGATDKWGRKESKSSGPTHYDGGRNIVFMAGGLSFAELRVVRDVMERESREIIAGGTPGPGTVNCPVKNKFLTFLLFSFGRRNAVWKSVLANPYALPL